MSATVIPYDGATISISPEALFWRPAENGKRLQRISIPDRAVEALVTRLDRDEWISVSNAGSYLQLLNSMFGQAQNAVSGFSLGPRLAKPITAMPHPSPTRGSPEALLKLVERWLAEDEGYDAEVWPMIKEDIAEYRLSDRDRFHG